MSKTVKIDEVEAVRYECGLCGTAFTGGVMEFIEGITPKCECDVDGDDFVTVTGFVLKTPPEAPQAAQSDDEKINWLDVLEAARDAVQESYKLASGMGEMQMARDMQSCYTYLGVVIDLWGLQIQKATAETQKEEPML